MRRLTASLLSWWERLPFTDVSGRLTADMLSLLLALAAALLAARDRPCCRASSVPSLILPFSDCVQSRGRDGFYRGAVDVTDSGARCMNWTEVAGFEERHPGKGIGEHNQCRNPDGRIRPWCFFRNHRGRVDWGYCDCKQGRGRHAGLLLGRRPGQRLQEGTVSFTHSSSLPVITCLTPALNLLDGTHPEHDMPGGACSLRVYAHLLLSVHVFDIQQMPLATLVI